MLGFLPQWANCVCVCVTHRKAHSRHMCWSTSLNTCMLMMLHLGTVLFSLQTHAETHRHASKAPVNLACASVCSVSQTHLQGVPGDSLLQKHSTAHLQNRQPTPTHTHTQALHWSLLSASLFSTEEVKLTIRNCSLNLLPRSSCYAAVVGICWPSVVFSWPLSLFFCS